MEEKRTLSRKELLSIKKGKVWQVCCFVHFIYLASLWTVYGFSLNDWAGRLSCKSSLDQSLSGVSSCCVNSENGLFLMVKSFSLLFQCVRYVQWQAVCHWQCKRLQYKSLDCSRSLIEVEPLVFNITQSWDLSYDSQWYSSLRHTIQIHHNDLH